MGDKRVAEIAAGRLWKPTIAQRLRCWLRGFHLIQWRSCALPNGCRYVCKRCGALDGFGKPSLRAHLTNPEKPIMTFEDAAFCCHVRSAIYRESNPTVRYPKNHFTPLGERVPIEDQTASDWQEHDPRDD